MHTRTGLGALLLLGVAACGGSPAYSNNPGWTPGLAVGAAGAQSPAGANPEHAEPVREVVTPYAAPYAPPRPPESQTGLPPSWRPYSTTEDGGGPRRAALADGGPPDAR